MVVNHFYVIEKFWQNIYCFHKSYGVLYLRINLLYKQYILMFMHHADISLSTFLQTRIQIIALVLE